MPCLYNVGYKLNECLLVSTINNSLADPFEAALTPLCPAWRRRLDAHCPAPLPLAASQDGLFSAKLWPGWNLLSPLQCLCSHKSLRRECTFPHFSLQACQENQSHSFKFLCKGVDLLQPSLLSCRVS